jgi:hypothetical protein
MLLATILLQITPPAAPKIPLIDLAFEAERQIVVDREAGQYLGHPTTCLLDDGQTVLCVYPKGHGKGGIVFKRSTDGGMTWSDRLPTPENWASSREVPTLHRIDDPVEGGKRLLMFSGLAPTRMASSDDDGETWTELKPIGDWGAIVAMASHAQRDDGTVVVWCHDDGRFMPKALQPGPGFHVYQVESKNGGRTWGTPRAIAHQAGHDLCEPGLVKSPDGKTWALLMRENSRQHNGSVILSTDAGRTWSDPQAMPPALTGDRHTARYDQDGHLVICFRDTTRQSVTQGDWVAWIGAWRDIVQGTEGRCRVRLMDNHHRWDCAYPGVELLPDGRILSVTYGHWTQGESPWIAAVHFRASEMLKRLGG